MSNKIGKILQEIGLKKIKKEKQFSAHIIKKHGALAERFLTVVNDRDAGSSENPYVIKNKNSEFSLDISSQFDQDRLTKFLNWFENQNYKVPKTVVDFGCDNGVLTCALAKLFPDSDIIGVDLEYSSVLVANELAIKMNLKNVSFIHGGEDQLVEKLRGKKVDIIISLFVFHEIYKSIYKGENEMDLSSIYNISNLNHQPNTLEKLSTILNADGRLISLDRWSNSRSVWNWHQILQDQNWTVNLSESFILEFIDNGISKATSPITVSEFLDKKLTISAELSLGFSSYFNLNKIQKHLHFKDDSAEAIWLSIRQNIAMKCTAKYHDQSGIETQVLSASGPMAYMYISTTTGYRELAVFSIVLLGDLISTLQEQFENKKDYADVSIEVTDLGMNLLSDLGYIID